MSTHPPDVAHDRAAVRRGLQRLLDRLDLDQLARDIVVASARQIPGHARLSDDLRWGPVHEAVREVIEICRRAILGSTQPHPDDVRAIEESARQRAAEGMPLEDMLRAYRLGMRLSWRALRSSSLPGEEKLLVVAAEALLSFVDIATGAVTRAYLSERAVPVPELERIARQLLGALDEDRPLTAEEINAAEVHGLRAGGPYVPFAVALRPGSAGAYSRLAEELRTQGVLAVSEGTRSLGLCARPDALDDVCFGEGHLLVVGHVTGPGGIAPACRALRAALAAGMAEGRRGRAWLTDFAPEVFTAVAPELADALVDRVVGDLPQDLRATLEQLVEHGFDRGATADRLGIHRNTLRQRLTRIRDLSGVDLGTARGQVTAYLAIRRREQQPAAAVRTAHRPAPTPGR